MRHIRVSQEEMDMLRSEIGKIYEDVLGRSMIANSYLPRYEELSELVSSRIKYEDKEFVSPVLLRRLYYYELSNKSATFNKGFIDACYRLISNGEFNRDEYYASDANYNQSMRKNSIRGSSHVWAKIIIPSCILLLILTGLFYLQGKESLLQSGESPQIEASIENEYFIDHFTYGKKGIEESSEWTVWNRDDGHYNVPWNNGEVYWNTPDSANHLTLYTRRGDMYVANDGKPAIPNLIAKEIGPGDVSITTRINEFKPRRNWQQAGLLLIQDDINMVRITYSFDDAAENRPRTRTHVLAFVDNLNIDLLGIIDLYLDKPGYRSKIWLRIDRKGNEYRFYYKPDFEGRGWLQAARWVAPDTFQPKYVALGAFQGISRILLSGGSIDLDWPPVPAHFDYFEIKPL